jgi:hypothetical protein
MTAARFNRPGLAWLPYRAGTYGSFFAAMKARLASADHAELSGLTTREGSDAAIALLDAWATVADVLTFYEERDANEGFLRTATEDRSIVELARLIGYRPRPGVAASVFLAYGLEKDARLTIKRGSRVQSIPGPGQLPQTYETSADLPSRAEWSALRPRLAKPQKPGTTRVLYFKGASLGLKPHDPLLFVDEAGGARPVRFARIHTVDSFFEQGLTRVVLQPGAAQGANPPAPTPPKETTFTSATLSVANRIKQGVPASAPKVGAPQAVSQLSAAALGDVLAELEPRVSSEEVQTVASQADVTPAQALGVYAFRTQSGPFGHAAPKRPMFAREQQAGHETERSLVGYTEWLLGSDGTPPTAGDRDESIGFESSTTVTLDSARDAILPGSWIAIIRPNPKKEPLALTLWRAKAVNVVSRANYGVSARATRIDLQRTAIDNVDTPADLEVHKDWRGWLQPEIDSLRDNTRGTVDRFSDLTALRRTVVYAQSERLELAEAPDHTPVQGSVIELDRFSSGIEAGRWLIVEGERADLLDKRPDTTGPDSGEAVPASSGVRAAEIVRVVLVEQHASREAGDTVHTHLTVSPPLANAYKRDTVTIYANVVPATHGETRDEILGSGDATKPYQSFSLKQAPMTFVPAATPSGVSSTLEVRVNDLQWHEGPGLIDAKGDERVFVTGPDEQGDVRVTFGDGKRGARLPTGAENIKARYRVGIGSAGNAAAGQVSQLMDRPLGAKEVRNPLPALGGADPDTARQAREIAPLTVHALDRLVSVDDYQHFAQLFAGIAKATASEVWLGVHTKIVVAVAGAGGMPIEGSALHASLMSALRQFGDPSRAIAVVDVERHMLVLKAGVRLLPDYQFDAVRTSLEKALFETFGFERRRLGDDLHLSEVLAVMQSVRGVQSVDVDVFATISDADIASEAAFDAKLESLKGERLPPERLPSVPPAAAKSTRTDRSPSSRLVYLSPRVPRSVLLQELA